MLLITLGLAYVIARAMSPKSGAAPGKLPADLTRKWKSVPAVDSSRINRVGEISASGAAVVARHALVFGKTFTEGWKASWREAMDGLWEPNDPDPDEPDEPTPAPDPAPAPKPPKPEPEKDKDPPAEPDPEEAPRLPGLEPSSYPYKPRERPMRLVKTNPDPAPTPPPAAAPPGRTSTMAAEVTGYQSLLQYLVDNVTSAAADLEIAKGDADSANKMAGEIDRVAGQVAALDVDAQSVAEVRAVAESFMQFATAQKAAAQTAERRMATAQLAHTNIRQRYQALVEAANAAPAVPSKQFITTQ